MYSIATTAGDEMGWDFVTAVIYNNKAIIQCLLQRNEKKIPNN